MFAVFLEMAINVFDHHDRGIDHHADAYRQAAERGEICRQSRVPHHMKATSMQKGIAAAVISEPRNLPKAAPELTAPGPSPSISD